MSARTKARKRAMDMLYLSDVLRKSPVLVLAAEHERALADTERLGSWGYAQEIVQGYIDNSSVIDKVIDDCAQGWDLERMPNIDRALLRVACWEILHNPQVPAAVAIDEAVELAKELSTENSPTFINGVLGAVVAAKDAGAI